MMDRGLPSVEEVTAALEGHVEGARARKLSDAVLRATESGTVPVVVVPEQVRGPVEVGAALMAAMQTRW